MKVITALHIVIYHNILYVGLIIYVEYNMSSTRFYGMWERDGGAMRQLSQADIEYEQEMPYSYFISRVGNTIYAKSGTKGIDYSGTDASTVIQSAIDAISLTGGKILFKVATYDLSSTLTILTDNIRLEGETRARTTKGVLFNYTGSSNCIEVGTDVLMVYNPIIKGIRILNDGTGVYGILVYANQAIIEDVQVSYFDIGIKLGYISGATESLLDKVVVNNSTYEGIIMEQADSKLIDIVSNYNETGLCLFSPVATQSGGIQCTNIHLWGNTATGLKIDDMFNCIITNIVSGDNDTYSVEIRSEHHEVFGIIIIGGLFWDNALGTSYVRFTNEGNNILDTEIIGCRFDSLQPAFDYFSPVGSVLSGKVIGCKFEGTIGSVPATIDFHHNLGYITEKTGTATITAGNTFVDVTHGLSITPTRLSTPPTNEYGLDYYLSNIGAVTFRINIQVPQLSNATFLWSAGN